MMSFRERLLKKKIKNREKKKLELLKKKGIIKGTNSSKSNIFTETDIADNEDHNISTNSSKNSIFTETEITENEDHIIGNSSNKYISEKSDSETPTITDLKIGLKSVTSEDSLTEKPGSHSSVVIPPKPKLKFSLLKGRDFSDETLRAIKDMGFDEMTDVQAKTIPLIMDGKELIVKAKTGSGKTLAYLIPGVEIVTKVRCKPRNGAVWIILCPTRELAIQTFGVLEELMKYHRKTYGLIMGGGNKQTEINKLQYGMNILVATPGRLLYHLQKTPYFVYKNLCCLVIDEVDKILKMGRENDMKQILNILHKRRRTLLFSATTSRKSEELTRIAFRTDPVYIGVHDNDDKAIVDGLDQGYVFCPPEKRFLLLFSFLRKYRSKKIMVFFSTRMSVEFHDMVLNYIGIPVMSIHGKQDQNKRTTTFFSFSNVEKGVLLCTNVAARGLDIPAVDWILQYDPPDTAKEYIHRVGRTARGGGIGHALLLLRPEENLFLYHLQYAKIPLNLRDFLWQRVRDIQPDYEKLISKNYALNRAAKDAFQSCVRSYESHKLKSVFSIKNLDFTMLAKNFGLTVPPPS